MMIWLQVVVGFVQLSDKMAMILKLKLHLFNLTLIGVFSSSVN